MLGSNGEPPELPSDDPMPEIKGSLTGVGLHEERQGIGRAGCIADAGRALLQQRLQVR